MLTKFIAVIALFIAMFITSVANYWFAWGLRPVSWGLVVVFFLLNLTLMALTQGIRYEKDKEEGE